MIFVSQVESDGVRKYMLAQLDIHIACKNKIEMKDRQTITLHLTKKKTRIVYIPASVGYFTRKISSSEKKN